MSDNSSKKHALLPDNVVRLTVDNILRRNNVKPEEIKKNLSDEQRQMLKEMIDDLQIQVDQFNNKEKNTKKSSE